MGLQDEITATKDAMARSATVAQQNLDQLSAVATKLNDPEPANQPGADELLRTFANVWLTTQRELANASKRVFSLIATLPEPPPPAGGQGPGNPGGGGNQ